MLDVKNAVKIFEKGSPMEHTALDHISLHVDDGEFVTVIGSNGAGKSTLFNAICGVFSLDAGSISLGGKDITWLPEHRRARTIGRVFQDPMRGTAPNMTIEENLSLAHSRTTTGASLPPSGIAESFAWDAAGNLISRTDGEGRMTSFAYDVCGRLVSVVDALGHATAYAYSDSGWLTNVTDAAGRSTAFARTPSGAVAAAFLPDGSVVSNAYDAADRLSQTTDARGLSVAFVRDAEGRIVARSSPSGNRTSSCTA